MRLTLLLIATALCYGAAAQNVFFFRDSGQSGYYDSGLAFRSGTSFLEQAGPTGDKIPVEYDTPPYEGSNALRLRWRSMAGGDWSALVIAPGFPFQNLTNSDTLSFWAYAPEAVPAAAMPLIYMEGAPGNTKTRRYSLGPYSGDLTARQWVQVKVPLSLFFDDPNQTNINFAQIKAIILGQDAADGQEHTLFIDEVKTYNGSLPTAPAAPPSSISARGFDSHVELNWQPGNEPQLAGYRIYRSLDGGQSFQPLRFLNRTENRFIDFVRPLGTNLSLQYRFAPLNTADQEAAPSSPIATATFDMSDEELLDMVQEYTFRYFWDFAHPASGMIRERNTSGNTVTIGGTGFGVMAILVGIERGFISRQQGLERLQLMSAFLENADRFRGAFPHWMNGNTGATIPFSAMDNGGDLVETAFLIQGLLTARAYFDRDDAGETLLREKITEIWEAVDWAWYRQNNQNLLYWHWSPNFGFAMNLPLRGWNETMIAYVLGIASPTHPIPVNLYHTGWAGSQNFTNGFTYFGHVLPLGELLGGPLFFAHYSYLGFDPRHKRDAYAHYWMQNRNQTLINRAYCINNSGGFAGYGENSWGLTASDDPLVGYLAHEPHPSRDNGTIAPTAALGSMPYTPGESMGALKHFYRELGQRLWGPMGFYDAFNLSQNWYATSYLAIDQGPIINMIENHRSQLLWELFMTNPEIQPALDAIGFVPDTIAVNTQEVFAAQGIAATLFPNPTAGTTMLKLELAAPSTLQIELYDSMGRRVAVPFQWQAFAPGSHYLPLELGLMPNGTYALRIQSETRALTERLVLFR
jgi:hypothetical protein